jgi:hypothetical protein
MRLRAIPAQSQPAAIVRAGVGIAGLSLIALAAALLFNIAGARALWPLRDGPMSFAFMSAIVAGSGAPLVWIALTRQWRALTPYGLSFALMDAPIAAYACALYARGSLTSLAHYSIAPMLSEGHSGLGVFACVFALAALVNLALALWARRFEADDAPLQPLIRAAMLVETGVLSIVGWLLVFQVPDILPWPLRPESSVMYGCVFLGLALYYIYPVIRPTRQNATGALLGFLAYDVVLIGPLIGRIPVLQPQHALTHAVALAIVVVSAGLALGYLVLRLPATTMPDRKQLT